MSHYNDWRKINVIPFNILHLMISHTSIEMCVCSLASTWSDQNILMKRFLNSIRGNNTTSQRTQLVFHFIPLYAVSSHTCASDDKLILKYYFFKSYVENDQSLIKYWILSVMEETKMRELRNYISMR